MSCSGSPPVPFRYHQFGITWTTSVPNFILKIAVPCIALIVPPTRAAFANFFESKVAGTLSYYGALEIVGAITTAITISILIAIEQS